MKTPGRAGLALVAMLSIVTMPLVVVAAEAELQQGVPYTHIVTDANGESHFENGVLPFSFMTLPAGDKAGLHGMKTGGEANYMMFQSGVFEDWHPTPNAQMLVVIQGEVEVGVSDGELRRFTPGMVVMMEDNSGKGHTTRTIGALPHIALMIRQPQK